MYAFLPGWYNWRLYNNTDPVNLCYVGLFVVAVWVLIHSTDYLFMRMKTRNNKGKKIKK